MKDTKNIKEVLELMNEYGIDYIKTETDQQKMLIIRNYNRNTTSSNFNNYIENQEPILQPNSSQLNNLENSNNLTNNQKEIKSPFVGTFYSKSSPEADTFIKIGDIIKKGQTICIIEAMKVMNEIESPYEGKVSKILLKDGDPVEYDTPIIIIEN